jgi:hypothetical protein
MGPGEHEVISLSALFDTQRNGPRADTQQMAWDLTMLPSDQQKQIADLCFNLIGLWSEWVDVQGPDHPLYNVYLTSKRMVEGLFEDVNSGGKHRA